MENHADMTLGSRAYAGLMVHAQLSFQSAEGSAFSIKILCQFDVGATLGIVS